MLSLRQLREPGHKGTCLDPQGDELMPPQGPGSHSAGSAGSIPAGGTVHEITHEEAPGAEPQAPDVAEVARVQVTEPGPDRADTPGQADTLRGAAEDDPSTRAAPRQPPVLPTSVRLVESGDLAFVYACWVRAVQAVRNRAFREVEHSSWPEADCRAVDRFLRLADTNWISSAQHALCERLLKRSLVLIACNPEVPDQIYGFLVVEPMAEAPVAHFLFVKKRFRRLGVASRLMANGCPGMVNGDVVKVTYRPPHELSTWPLQYRSSYLYEEEGSNR